MTTWMNLEHIMLSEISQTEKNKKHDFIHMWNTNKKVTNKNQFIDTNNRVVVTRRKKG